ncbi:unnamed protein product [Protopolystoma xenopodis]|uniref:Uncharacterized protein n=1 Tax=Protopolystoma xenopodis TaxID=117903 RepID=A0A448WT25_9PLAT|nr:unnamed protein product [Protopolystoma xenopodis]
MIGNRSPEYASTSLVDGYLGPSCVDSATFYPAPVNLMADHAATAMFSETSSGVLASVSSDYPYTTEFSSMPQNNKYTPPTPPPLGTRAGLELPSGFATGMTNLAAATLVRHQLRQQQQQQSKQIQQHQVYLQQQRLCQLNHLYPHTVIRPHCKYQQQQQMMMMTKLNQQSEDLDLEKQKLIFIQQQKSQAQLNGAPSGISIQMPLSRHLAAFGTGRFLGLEGTGVMTPQQVISYPTQEAPLHIKPERQHRPPSSLPGQISKFDTVRKCLPIG